MPSRSSFALVGIAAGAVTLGVAELLAAAWTMLLRSAGTPSPLFAVGAAFVDATPAWLKDWAIAVFGTADKAALGVGMAVTLTAVCAAVGVLLRRSRVAALLLFIGVGWVGMAAVWGRPSSSVLDVVPAGVGLLAGVETLNRLRRRWVGGSDRPAAATPRAGQARSDARPDVDPSPPGAPPGASAAASVGAASRRSVLRTAGGLTALGVLGVLAGQAWSAGGRAAQSAAAALALPRPRRRVSVPAGAGSDIAGHTPFVTPAEEFYRIDTALRVPRVDPDEWRLRVTGLVDREIELSLADLLAQDHVEAFVTLACVSNEVGGDLVGNARWQGWPVRELLARAGVRPEADMVLSRSVDGFTAGTPLEALTDERDSLLAVGMNGAPLPRRHGFPVRLVVPGLYGYVSATKWVTELKVTRFDADEGYWTPRGWAAEGPIKTASRIDVPRDRATAQRDAAGNVVVAGVAWAQQRGVRAVEVQVDDGEWREAELLRQASADTWRLWRWTWPGAQPGEHVVRVRATDGTGATQTTKVAPPAPDGATGLHGVRVSIE